MRVTKITPRIFHFQFPTKEALCRTFVRFQEHYESPKFAGKVFTLSEFKKWYTANSPEGRKTGKFTYYTDWSGFNFPDRALRAFRAFKFDPLSKGEQKVLDALNGITGKFYVIGTYKGGGHALDHEVAHALYYTNAKYRQLVDSIVAEYDTKTQKNALLTMGYGMNVLVDEVQAYCVSDNPPFSLPIGLRERVREVFQEMNPQNKTVKKHRDAKVLASTVTFTLNKKETQRFYRFRTSHRQKCRGTFTTSFTPTGIGDAIEMKCGSCGAKKTISDYGSW